MLAFLRGGCEEEELELSSQPSLRWPLVVGEMHSRNAQELGTWLKDNSWLLHHYEPISLVKTLTAHF